MTLKTLIFATVMFLPTMPASADAWDFASNPSHFGGNLAEQTEALPVSGQKPALTGVTLAIARAFRIPVREVESSLVATTTDSGTAVYGFIYQVSQEIVYVFEVDREGIVVGGGYASEGSDQHPDFIWSPGGLGKSPKKIRRIPTARIQALLEALESDGQPVLCPDCLAD